MEDYYPSQNSAWMDYGSALVFTAVTPFPVPAPFPLLGLGAATAFSRQLKQRIAMKRKREEGGVLD